MENLHRKKRKKQKRKKQKRIWKNQGYKKPVDLYLFHTYIHTYIVSYIFHRECIKVMSGFLYCDYLPGIRSVNILKRYSSYGNPLLDLAAKVVSVKLNLVTGTLSSLVLLNLFFIVACKEHL